MAPRRPAWPSIPEGTAAGSCRGRAAPVADGGDDELVESGHGGFAEAEVANTGTEEADLVNAATPFGILPSRGAEQLAAANAMDRELLDSLAAAGFQLSQGPHGQGVLGLIYGQNATGYYFNAGASELIVDGTIKLRRGSVTGLGPTGVALADRQPRSAKLSGTRPPTGWASSPRSARTANSAESGDALVSTDSGS